MRCGYPLRSCYGVAVGICDIYLLHACLQLLIVCGACCRWLVYYLWYVNTHTDDRPASPSVMELQVFINGSISLVDEAPSRSSALCASSEPVALHGHVDALWRVRVQPSPRSAKQTRQSNNKPLLLNSRYHVLLL